MVEALPRASAQSETYEVVAVLKGDALVIYVDRYADNRPVTNAYVDITIGDRTLRAERLPDGVFRVQAAELQRAGKHELVFAIRGEAGDDLLIASLQVPQPAAAGEAQAVQTVAATWPSSSLVIAASGLAVLVIALSAARLGLGRAVLIGLLALVGFLLLGALPIPAHEGHNESTPSQTLTGDRPRRLADAIVFLPKPSQRLLEVRTIVAQESYQKPTVSFVGRIIADPNASGLVQSTIGGRITPAAGGLPKLGQAVKAGEVLGYVQPPFAAIDQTQVAQTAGELEQQIALALNKLDRARRLYATNAGTRVTVEEAEIQLKGLERRRAALHASQIKPEPLVAPVNGVIAGAKLVAGQVVAPQDILFQIVDPASLWVEAFSFDAAVAANFTDAKGVAQDGVPFVLSFVGRSRTLQQQSTVLHFRIETPPSTLNVGMPAHVFAEVGEPVQALVVPKAAVVRASNGDSQLWLHTDPERFVARPVRVSSYDGARVLVLAGLKSGERVVVEGAELLNQVR